MREQDLQTKIIKTLTKADWYVVNGNFTRGGIPDLICCSPTGKFVGIEVKLPKTRNNTTKLQELNIELINNLGGKALVVWDMVQIKELIDEEHSQEHA